VQAFLLLQSLQVCEPSNTRVTEGMMPRAPDVHRDQKGAVGCNELDQFHPANRRRLSALGLRTFLRIADLWGLTEHQRLVVIGYPYRSRYTRWCEQAHRQKQLTLSVDVLTRISAVLGIHQALQILHTDEAHAIEWLRTPCGAIVFGGHQPLELLTSGTQDSLLTVRRFLDSSCEGCSIFPTEFDAGFSGYDDGDIIVG